MNKLLISKDLTANKNDSQKQIKIILKDFLQKHDRSKFGSSAIFYEPLLLSCYF